MNNLELDIKIAQLLSSRVCHDLINAANGVSFSLEVCKNEENIDLSKEAIKLAYHSSVILAAKLSFFRLSFGATMVGEGKTGLVKAKNSIYQLFQEKDVSFDWKEQIDEELEKVASNDNLKILLNVFLIIFYCIPKSARVQIFANRINAERIGIAFLVQGSGVRFGLDNLKDITYRNIEQLTPRNIQTYLTFALAKQAGSEIEMKDSTKNEITIAVSMKTR